MPLSRLVVNYLARVGSYSPSALFGLVCYQLTDRHVSYRLTSSNLYWTQ